MSTQLLPQSLDDQPHISARQPAATGPQPDASALAQMDLIALARRCDEENQLYRAGQPNDSSYAYELFRRAMVERSDAAWEQIYHQYRPLAEHWVRHNAAFDGSSESYEALVGQAFARFWQAIPPERFDHFSTTPALLHYLQLCAACVVIDSARAATMSRVLSQEARAFDETHERSPDEQVLERMRSEELWRCVTARLNGEAERVVVFESFVSGLKPREIYSRRRDLFASVQDIYTIKRNVLNRLSRDREVRGMLG